MTMNRIPAVCLSVWLAALLSAAQQPGQLPTVTGGGQGGFWHDLAGPYTAPAVSAADFTNSTRLDRLLRAGNIYLSLHDAVALAIENNLDIELDRYSLPIASSELLRAKGGGQLRGILYTLAEAPAGIGGPNSPLVTTTATSQTPGSSVATSAAELAVLGESQTNLSVLGALPLSTGPALPMYDPSIYAQYNWQHQTTPETAGFIAGVPALAGSVQNGNAGYLQGFGTGTQVNLAFNNTAQATNSLHNSYNPYIASDLGLTVTQPLLRGFGPAVNRRYIRIAKNEGKITDLLLRQQVIETVYGVVRLYTDLVALGEDVKVKEETLAFAHKLFEDTKSQVDEGTLAPVELTRAQAQVSASQQDLINSRGNFEEQEAILKNVLTRRGNEDPEVRSAHIIPTDSLAVPPVEDTAPMDALIELAYKNRPDLAQAGLQIANSELSLKGSRNALLPEVDLVGTAQNNALAGAAYPAAGAVYPPYVGGYGAVLNQIATRKNPTYGIGVNVTLPVRNRVAEADAARDGLQLRQSQVRQRQLRNQVQLEVEDAVIAMRRSRAAYAAAIETRKLQEQSLELEQAKFTEGASTSFFVIQYRSYVAQARSTEVAAASAYLKARAALDRATGSILDVNGVSIDAAVHGKM